MFVGKNRSGKSMAALNMALILDKNFTLDDVVYTPDEFFDRVGTINKVGRAIVPDEIGTLLSSREWYSINSRAINFTIQTIGYLRPILLFVAPDFSYIDSQPKKLFSEFFEVSRRTYDQFSSIKPFNIQIDRKKGKMYFHYPRVLIKGFGLVKIHRLKIFNTPPEDFVKEYEKKSFPYKKKLQERMEQMSKDSRKSIIKSGEEYLTEKDVIDRILEAPDHYSRRGKIDVNFIINDFKIEGKKIPRNKALIIRDVIERDIKESRGK
jgi:hypothetical protein